MSTTRVARFRSLHKLFYSLERHGVDYCLAVTNGTHAIELALEALEIGFGDEVLIPAYTFIATATAVLMRNAIPVPVEVQSDNYCLDASRIEEMISPRTKAIIPVHISGHACDMDNIMAIARKHNLAVIEDCAHAHGSTYKGRPLGSFGDAATFSFQASKTMTSGEGGAFITKRKDLYEKAFLIFNCGRPLGPSYDHLVLASNFRMSEIQAALLIGQLDRLSEHTEQRARSVNYLNSILKKYEGIVPQSRADYASIQGYSMYMFRYKQDHFNAIPREQFVKFLSTKGISAFRTYPVFFATKLFDNVGQKYAQYANFKRHDIYATNNYPISNQISEEVVWIPHYFLLNLETEIAQLEVILEDFMRTQCIRISCG